MTFQAAQIDPQAFRTFDLASAYNNGMKVGNSIRDIQDDNALQQYHQANPNATPEQTLAWAYQNMAPRNADYQLERNSRMADQEEQMRSKKLARKEHAIELAVKGAEFLKNIPQEEQQSAWQNWIAPMKDMDPEMHAWASSASLPHMMMVAQQRQAEAERQAKRQDWQDKAAIELSQNQQQKLFENSLPPSQAQQADWTRDEAKQRAGFENQMQLKQLELENKQPPADFMTKGKAVMDLESALNQYRDLVKDYGTEVLPGQNKTALKSAYTNLQMKLKEAMNLGVLNGPDVERIGSMITDPTSLGGVGQTIMTGGGNPYLTQVDEVATDLANTRKNLESIYGKQVPQAAQGVSRPITKTGIDQRTGKQVTLILRNGQWVPQ